MGIIDTIVMGIFGVISLNKDNKRIEQRNIKMRQWLEENGYDINKQMELERWCRDNVEHAIEQAYGYAYKSLPWEKIYRQFIRGNEVVRKHVCSYFCDQNGIKYFDFRSPPEEYTSIT